MSALESDFLNRAAPPGSMRYFALLYASAKQRESLTALFVIDAEIRASTLAAHEVAHTRLQWWRAEIDRLVNRNAQHPATQTLQAAMPAAEFSILHELLMAADMDMAHMTYNTGPELNAYLHRSGGAIFELASRSTDGNARRAGALIRRVETLRDLTIDSRNGRVYWPLDELENRKISIEQLARGQSTDAIRRLLATEIARLRAEFDVLQILYRPLIVLAKLHVQLLNRIERANCDVFSQRHELGPWKKSWTAWRAARRS